jgi:ribosomal-protein-alanine N-acetyltransferase
VITQGIDMPASIDLSERAGPVLVIAPDVCLRPLAASEVTASYIDGINDPQINKFLVSAQSGPQTLAGVKEWVSANWRAHDAILFGIFCSRIHCGNIRAHDVTSRSASIGIAIFDSKMHGKGIGRAAISALVRYLTDELGVKSVVAGIDEENVASQRAFAKAGFERLPVQDAEHCALWGFVGRGNARTGNPVNIGDE